MVTSKGAAEPLYFLSLYRSSAIRTIGWNPYFANKSARLRFCATHADNHETSSDGGEIALEPFINCEHGYQKTVEGFFAQERGTRAMQHRGTHQADGLMRAQVENGVPPPWIRWPDSGKLERISKIV